MSLTLTLKGRLIMETGSHIPLFSFLAAFWEQWVIAERLGFVPRVRLDEVHAPTTANTQAPTQTHTHTAVGYAPALWGPPPSPPHSLTLSISLSRRASVDCVPRGTSNSADVASVGQQQISPGGTTAERTTGTAQRVRLQHPHKDTHTQRLELLTPFVKILFIFLFVVVLFFCWVALNSYTDLQTTVNFADYMSYPWS